MRLAVNSLLLLIGLACCASAEAQSFSAYSRPASGQVHQTHWSTLSSSAQVHSGGCSSCGQADPWGAYDPCGCEVCEDSCCKQGFFKKLFAKMKCKRACKKACQEACDCPQACEDSCGKCKSKKSSCKCKKSCEPSCSDCGETDCCEKKGRGLFGKKKCSNCNECEEACKCKCDQGKRKPKCRKPDCCNSCQTGCGGEAVVYGNSLHGSQDEYYSIPGPIEEKTVPVRPREQLPMPMQQIPPMEEDFDPDLEQEARRIVPLRSSPASELLRTAPVIVAPQQPSREVRQTSLTHSGVVIRATREVPVEESDSARTYAESSRSGNSTAVILSAERSGEASANPLRK